MCIPATDWFVNGSVSFELIKGLPAALIALGLGFVATRIQQQQAKVATAKLNLDLFERRYKLFEATWHELSQAVQREHIAISNPEFTNLFPSAQFLFGMEIRDYMDEISKNCTKLWLIQERTRANQNIVPQELITAQTDLLKWFAKQAMEDCRARFGPYLDFSKWK
ncbi:hypothetical protein [Rhodoferax saidenbachensis]|nr:hypothetical protein [Rhodoferax saidenbachensis]